LIYRPAPDLVLPDNDRIRILAITVATSRYISRRIRSMTRWRKLVMPRRQRWLVVVMKVSTTAERVGQTLKQQNGG